MARLLWKQIDKLNIDKKHKYRIFLLINSCIYALLGYIVWLIIGKNFFTNKEQWMLCFVGYPAVFGGFFMGMYVLYKMNQ